MAEPGEAAGQDGGTVAQGAQGADQPLRPFGELDAFAYPLQGTFIQPLEQGHSGTETFVEIQLAAHGPLGDFCYLFAHPGFHGQLVDYFRANQGGIHIEHHKAPVTAEGAVALEGDVQVAFVGNVEEGRAHGFTVLRLTAHGNLDAGATVLVERFPFQMHPAGQAGDAVNVQAVVCHCCGHVGELFGSNLARQQGDDMAVLALAGHPFLVAVFVDGTEAHIDVQLVGLEQQILEHRRGFRVRRGFHQDAQRQGVVDYGLADIQDIEPVTGQNPGESGGQTGTVTTGYLNQNDLAHAWAPGGRSDKRKAEAVAPAKTA